MKGETILLCTMFYDRKDGKLHQDTCTVTVLKFVMWAGGRNMILFEVGVTGGTTKKLN